MHKLIHRVEALSSYILLGQGDRRSKIETSGSRREGGRDGIKDASANNDSTYKKFSKVRESKIPDGRSVRALNSRSLKTTRDEIHQVFRVGSISWPIAQYY